VAGSIFGPVHRDAGGGAVVGSGRPFHLPAWLGFHFARPLAAADLADLLMAAAVPAAA
jgi:hypothetical protein